MNIARYKEQIRIDKNALDDALISQPMTFMAVSGEYANAISVRDAAKEAVTVARASSYFEERELLEKPTEALVSAKVDLSRKYRKAVRVYLEAKLAADEWFAAKEAWQQRAFVLKDLASLYIAGYFSDASVRGPDSRGVQREQYEEDRKVLADARRKKGVGKKSGRVSLGDK